ncbi:hypothetical protein [Paenibacillus dakarensis]|uniref:hypothetical protein n=1 Tax=Paenibacillus dakarensis TaxID=1527293 RepID=UPI0006D5686F|nr:hypothetical protein [Paenibacillus dakarensis]
MNAFQFIMSLFVLALLFGIINLVLNYVSRRDGTVPVPMRIKLWLIPVLSMIIIIPVFMFSVLFAVLFHVQGLYQEASLSMDLGNLISFSVMVLLGFIFFESFVHPITMALLRLWLRRDAAIYTKQLITILIDTCILYFISMIITGLSIAGIMEALSIAVFYHLIEWLLMGFQAWLQRRKQSRSIA